MSITTIAPSITTNNTTEYKELCERYYPFAKRVHLDSSDGTLTSSRLILPSGLWWPKGWQVDIHLMSATPSLFVNDLIKLKPNLVILHAEAKEDLLPIFTQLKDAGIRVGVAIIKNVYPGSIKNILTSVDHAMIFSGNLGSYGGEADLLLLEKVALIREINKTIEIGWDGGANLENTKTITQGGVDVINVGSAISQAEDSAKAFSALNDATEDESVI